MTTFDWTIVGLYMLGLLGVGFWAARRKSHSTEDFFVAGRTLPWWLAGTSMLATNFSADTPLQTTRMIREFGMGGNWFYWGMILSHVGVAFFFARLWRRTGVITDAHFMELRYGGKGAAVLRGAVGLFRGALLELLTLSWIILAMTKVVRVILNLPPTITLAGTALNSDLLVVFVLVFFALLYSVTSGLWGVVLTDFVEFIVAVLGTVVLSIVAMIAVGGADGLKAQLAAGHHPTATDFFPDIGGAGLPMVAIVVYLFVQWWATPYVDGSGQRAQRFLACKDEQHALVSGIWNLAVQWIFRAWPVYLVGLASLVLYPAATDHESVYVQMVYDMAPIGLRGIMVAGFFSAFMSTFEGIINLCASYLSNDVYRRFVAKDRDEKHQVLASRSISVGVAVAAGIISLYLPSILTAYRLKMELMAGLGLVSLLRWFWWRINAKTELATLAVSVLGALSLNFIPGLSGDSPGQSALRLLLVVGVSALVTVGVALLTKPEPNERLVEFFERVRPPKALWGPIAGMASPGSSSIKWRTLIEIGVCLVFVFGGMFGLGWILLGDTLQGVLMSAVGAAALVYLYRKVLRTQPAEPAAPGQQGGGVGTAGA